MASVSEVMRVAKREDAKFIQKCPKWKGKDVWQLIFVDPNDGMQEIGIPTFIVFGWSGAKFLTDKEALEYMRTLNEDEESEDPIEVT